MQEAIAVLVVNRNYGRFIQQTLDSVYAQSHPSVALIVCDDASTDDSWQSICSWTATHSKRFSRTELHVGTLGRGKNAWINSVIEKLPEQLVVILDSDDTVPPHYLAELVQELRSSPGVDFVYTDCDLLDAGGSLIGTGRSRPFEASLVETFSYIPEPALIKTDCLRTALPLDESVKRGTKHEKYKRIVRSGGVGKHTERIRFRYRMHDQNLSGIGTRVLAEIETGRAPTERLLSGYWPLSNGVEHRGAQ